MKSMLRTAFALGLMATSTTIACSVPADTPEESSPEDDAGSVSAALYRMDSSRGTNFVTVNICFKHDSHYTYADEQLVLRALNQSWAKYMNLYFVNLGDCAAPRYVPNPAATTSVAFDVGDTASCGTDCPDGAGSYCQNACLWNGRIHLHNNESVDTVAHEFGHVLGFAHEQDRPDNPPGAQGCHVGVVTQTGGTYVSPLFDKQSIMSYCHVPLGSNPFSTADMVYGQSHFGAPRSFHRLAWLDANTLRFWDMKGAAVTYTSSLDVTGRTYLGEGRVLTGKPTLIFADTATGAVTYVGINEAGEGQLATTAAPIATGGSVAGGWQFGAIGDFNQDGIDDLVWQNPTTDQVGIWLNNGVGGFSTALFNGAGIAGGARVVGAGEFGGTVISAAHRSRSDIVFHHPTTGAISVWLMNGASRTGTQLLANVGSTQRVEAVIGSIGGGGTSEIVLHHWTNGTVVGLFFSNTTLIGSSTFPSLGGEWEVAAATPIDQVTRYATTQSPSSSLGLVWVSKGSYPSDPYKGSTLVWSLALGGFHESQPGEKAPTSYTIMTDATGRQ